MTFAETYKNLFDGDKFMHVRILSIDPVTKKKKATEVKQPFDVEKHLSEEIIQGRSNVDMDRKACLWNGWDIDQEMPEREIGRQTFILNTEFCPFKSTNGRWHVYLPFDDWKPVEEAYEIRNLYMKKFKDLGWTVDKDKCLPTSWNFENKRPGAVLFLPTFKGHKVCYSPRGTPLTKEQFQLRIKHRKHPLLVGAIGLRSGQSDGGRAKALFNVGLYLKYVKVEGLTLHDVNKKFFTEPENEKEVSHVYNDSLAKDKYSGEKGLKHLIHNYQYYTEQLTGCKLPLPGALKDIEGADDIVRNFDDVEPEDEKLLFFKNVIYIKDDDRYFDLRTFKPYRANSIDVDYQKIFKKNTPTYNFAKTPVRQVVETKCYRPDKWKKDKPPIFKGEDKQLHINSYRPGGVEAIDPHTDQHTKNCLDKFMKLMEFLYEEPKEMNWVLDWFSTIFQKPGEKIRHSLLTYSKFQQIGKSTLFKTIQKALGEDNCSIISPKQAIDKGKAFLIGKQLVLIDELRITGSKVYKGVIMDILKPLMTEEEHDARPLFQDWRRVFTTTNFCIFTNHEDAISVDYETEARHSVFENLEKRLSDGFYKEYWDLFKNGKMSHVVKHFLSKRKIREYDDLKPDEKEDGKPLIPLFSASGTCLKTEALKRMSEKGDTLFEDVKDLIKQRMEPFHQDIISITETFNYLKSQEKEITRQNELAEVLTKLEGERIGECKHLLTGKTPVLWRIRNHEKYKKKTNTDVASDFWVPMKPKEWDMEKKDIDRVKHNIKDLLDDPEWLKQEQKEWQEKHKKKEEELDLEEAPF